MSKTQTQYTIIREYKNYFGTDELVKRILRFHIQNDMVLKTSKGYSNQEVIDYERQHYGL